MSTVIFSVNKLRKLGERESTLYEMLVEIFIANRYILQWIQYPMKGWDYTLDVIIDLLAHCRALQR